MQRPSPTFCVQGCCQRNPPELVFELGAIRSGVAESRQDVADYSILRTVQRIERMPPRSGLIHRTVQRITG